MSRQSRRLRIPSALRGSSVRISPEEAHERISAGALLIDVRREDDPNPALAGSVRIPPDLFPERAAGLRREVAIVLACT